MRSFCAVLGAISRSDDTPSRPATLGIARRDRQIQIRFALAPPTVAFRRDASAVLKRLTSFYFVPHFLEVAPGSAR